MWSRVVANVRAIWALRGDLDAHGGDVAVLKADLVGMNARAELRPRLAAVRDYRPDIDMEALRALPDGTFGRETARFLDDNGLTFVAVSDAVAPEIRERNAYGIRYAATHDLFHVLLGYGPDWVGEMGVLAFTCGQDYTRTLWVQAFFAWLLYPVLSLGRFGALYRAWTAGVAQGRAAPFLLAERLEDLFDRPLDEVRARYGLA